MDYKTSFKLTKEYFSECFDQSVRYGNKWRKFEYIIGTVFLLVGACLLVYTSMTTLTPFVLLFIGFYELFNPPIKKIWWVKRQMNSKVANSFVEISMNWTGIEKVVKTPKGLLIWPQKGMHIYLKKKSMPEEAINFIRSKTV